MALAGFLAKANSGLGNPLGWPLLRRGFRSGRPSRPRFFACPEWWVAEAPIYSNRLELGRKVNDFLCFIVPSRLLFCQQGHFKPE